MHHGGDTGAGVDLGDGVFVSLGLAAAVSAALVARRRRQRRWYVPGSGRRDDLPVAPVIRNLHLAHLRATQPAHHHTDVDTDIDDDEVDNPPRSSEPASDRSQPGTVGDPAGRSVPVGIAAGHGIVLDLAVTQGLGLIGPGAPAAARALLAHLLAVDTRDRNREVSKLLVDAAAARLLGLPADAAAPGRMDVVPDAEAALDLAEIEITRHTRLTTPPGTAHGADRDSAADDDTAHASTTAGHLVLVVRPPANTRRLQAVLDTGSGTGVAGVVLGQWRPGASIYVDADGTVTATNPGPASALRGTRLFQLPAPGATELIQLLTTDPPAIDPASSNIAVSGAPARTAPHGSAGGSSEGAGRPPERGRRTEPPALTLGRDGAAPTPRSRRQTAGAPSARPVPLSLTVLGVMRLTWTPTVTTETEPPSESVDLTGRLGARLRELLALLALHPDGIGRDQLADTLWPDGPAERPFAALHTSLSRLRSTLVDGTEERLRDVVTTSGERYRLDPRLVEVDYRAFDNAVAARRNASDDSHRLGAYRQIVAAYTGELAKGLSSEWLEAPREAARRDAVDAATALARLVIGADPRAALDHLETARAFDPYNEAIYRDIMKVQRRLGQPDAIERTLALLTTRLAELDETPDVETLALVDRLRHGAPSTSPSR